MKAEDDHQTEEEGHPQAEPSGSLFQFEIDGIGSAQLEAEIETLVAARPGSLDYLHALPRFGDPLPLAAEDLAALPDHQLKLAYHLRFLNQMYTERPTGPVLTSSPATAVPILGPLWGRIRAQMHQLILFYVGRSDAHQAEVNHHLLQIVAQLTETVAHQNDEIARLRSERATAADRQSGNQKRDDR